MTTTTSPVQLPEQQDLIAGQRRLPATRPGGWLTHPDTGARITQIRQTSSQDVNIALAAASEVHRRGDWATADKAVRATLLHAFADALEPLTEQIAVADAVDSGIPIAVTRLFAAGLSDIVRGAVNQLQSADLDIELPGTVGPVRRLYAPWGPAAVIAPFNSPSFTAVKKSAYALAAGAPVVVKPSSSAPSGPNLVATAIQSVLEHHSMPAALFQLLHGGSQIGNALSIDPRIRAISFTGGRVTGVHVARAAAPEMKALQLELGSNNPVIVRSDADVDRTADALVAGFTKLNGQWCESPGAVFAARAVHDRLLDALLDRLSALRAGSCLDPSTQFGPQSSRQQRDDVTSAVSRLEASGGTALSSTPAPDIAGWYVPPVVIVGADPTATVEEIFGPVLTLHPTDSDEQSLELANRRAGGLAGYVFSADEEAAMALGARLDDGEIKVNGTSLLDLSPSSTQAFWGGSGVGGHGNAELLRFFTGAKIVGVDDPSLPL